MINYLIIATQPETASLPLLLLGAAISLRQRATRSEMPLREKEGGIEISAAARKVAGNLDAGFTGQR